ncbi:MAG: hypothetical protein Q9222_001997, partial [Ikaeria aurantiellina]
MSQVFRFGFGNEDVDPDLNDHENENEVDKTSTKQQEQPPSTCLPCLFNLPELFHSLPSRISYNTLTIPTFPNHSPTLLPRRELFDIRAQLMAEDVDLDNNDTPATAGLSTDDIKPNIYEGGFKTWECSVDLASYLAAHTAELTRFAAVTYTVVEMGAGTALPTLLLFQHLLSSSTPSSYSHPKTIILADFNLSVLQLATIPNLLLTYALNAELIPPGSGDLDITPSLLSSFQEALAGRNIHIRAISGSWSFEFAPLIFADDEEQPGKTLILASETIYSPSSTRAFTDTVMDILRKVEQCGGRARA